MLTDPDSRTWYDGNYGPQSGEIGDIVARLPVAQQRVVLNGYCVQKEANRYDQAMSPLGSYAYPVYYASSAAMAAPSAQNVAAAPVISNDPVVTSLDKATVSHLSPTSPATLAHSPLEVDAAFGDDLADTLTKAHLLS